MSPQFGEHGVQPSRFKVAHYVAQRRGARVDLLLGPFTELGMAVSALDAARECAYMADAEPTPAQVEAITLPVRSDLDIPSGRLNSWLETLYNTHQELRKP